MNGNLYLALFCASLIYNKYPYFQLFTFENKFPIENIPLACCSSENESGNRKNNKVSEIIEHNYLTFKLVKNPLPHNEEIVILSQTEFFLMETE